LTEYVEYQKERTTSKTAADLADPDEWTFADLETMARIIEADMQTVTESTHSIPAIDEAIQEVEKSLKKSIFTLYVTNMSSGSKEAGIREIRPCGKRSRSARKYILPKIGSRFRSPTKRNPSLSASNHPFLRLC
jgi:hypothetical protein